MPGRAVRQPRFAELQKHSGYHHGRMRISVLDTAPIVAGSSARQASCSDNSVRSPCRFRRWPFV
jgi:hypothetical protein